MEAGKIMCSYTWGWKKESKSLGEMLGGSRLEKQEGRGVLRGPLGGCIIGSFTASQLARSFQRWDIEIV